ncbi:hypothetical protein [Hyphomonas jannaschiana]|uniref:hypothetical protein n=1 Tax=Hyphomonas jannaschiana TaxID=86 RepID=UPI0035C7557A
MTEITGTSGNDTLDGTSDDDTISGGDGNDRIDGGYGNDLLEGDAGHDVLIGGDGDDTLVGGAGQDIFFGGAGTDTFDGGEGTDSLYFGAYEDLEDGGQDSAIVVDVTAGTASYNGITETFTSIETFWLANGNDTFVGSNGNDTVYGQIGDDYLSGGDGDDFLGGGSGDDTLVGGAGNDRIAGGVGTDIIDAGAGDDTVSFLSNEGEILDTVDGGDGTDRIQLVWVAQGPGYYSFDSSISGFEEISIVFGAGQQDQRLIFDAEFFRNNSITMIDPWQHEVQGQSVSIEVYMDEEVFLDLSALQFSENWNDFASNGEVGDTLKIIGDDSSETIIGSEVNAEINAGGGNDTVYGGLGDDTLIGGAGDDYLSGGFGNDAVFGGEGNDRIENGSGQNTIDAGSGNDIVIFGGDDGEVDDFIDGGDGVDTAQFVAFPANGDYVHVNSSVVGFEVIEGFFAASSAGMPAPVLNLQLDAAFFQANQISNIRSNAHNADGSHFNITVLMGDETTVDLSALQFDANWNNYTPYGATGDSLTIIGDDANETIIGTSYSNIIRGGGGDDLLTGGIDMDRFEFFHGDGNDTITNFDPVWDLIILRGFSQTEIDAVYSERLIDGNDIVLSFSDGGSLRLQNVNSEDFSKNQLVGAPAEPDIPGDTSTDTWIVPGETLSSEIESSADSDWLRFSVGADEYLAIEISAEGNLETTIRDASGNALNLSTTRFQTIYDPVTGNQVLLLKHLPKGDYILDLSAYSSRAYTIDARILEDEFSADTSTTGHIALGDTLESTFAFEGDKDWIRFDGVEGQVLRFSFNTASSVIDGYGPALYDASGNLVDLPGYLGQNVTTNPATGEQYFTFEVPSTGEYFLRLYGSFSEPGFDAAYTVSMSELDDIPADVSTTAILVQPGETILGELEIAGDSDWFAIDVAGPQTIRFLATGDQDSLWTSSLTLTFYDEAGNVIGTGRPEYDGNYDLIGNGFLHADHAGRYYVAVEGGNTNTGFYSLTATPLDYGTPVPTSDGTSIHAGGGIYGSIGTTGLPDGLLATALILTGSNGYLELSVGIIDPVADQQLSSVRLGLDGANVAASALQSFDGGFAAVYIIADYDTSTSTLMAAFFDESGTQTGEPVVLGGITGTQSGLTQELGVIRNADGSIGITAGINTPDGAQLYLLDIASSGTVQAVTLVASLDGASVSDPTLVLLETGERLVSWIESSATSGLTQHTSFIDSAGSANPGVRAGPDLSFAYDDAVVTAVEGGFAVLRSMGTHYELQLFDLDGTARGGPVSIGTVGGTPGTYDFDVLGMADGTIVTATTGPDGVQINRFDANGTLLGESTQEYSNWNTSRNVHLTALSDTSFSLLFGSGAGYEFQVNTFDLPPVMTRLDGSDGAEHLDGSSLDDFIRGFAGDDYLTGLSGDDDLFGGTGNDHILGGDGLDRLIAGGGSDKMLGGKGADTFVLTADGIADTISDFDFREDHIEIVRADGLQGMSDLTITQDGRDVVITGQGLEVRLYDTSAEALHAGHFVFVDDIDDSFIALPEPANNAAEAQAVDKPVVFEDLFPDGLPEPADQVAIHPVLTVDYELDAHDHWVITPGDTPLDPGWFLS